MQSGMTAIKGGHPSAIKEPIRVAGDTSVNPRASIFSPVPVARQYHNTRVVRIGFVVTGGT